MANCVPKFREGKNAELCETESCARPDNRIRMMVAELSERQGDDELADEVAGDLLEEDHPSPANPQPSARGAT